MAFGKMSVVRVDLHATRARYEAGASSGSKYDTRLIIYTNDVKSRHRYVRVELREALESCAYAELRPSTDGSNWFSMGLLASLGLESQDQASHLASVEVVVSVHQGEAEKTKCKCSTGTIGRLRVHFATRSRPPRAIVEGLQRSIPTLLRGIDVWEGRRCMVSWFNMVELVQFQDVEMQALAEGASCCSAIGHASAKTAIVLSFQDDKNFTGAASSVSFQAVADYTRRVDDSLGGVSDQANRVITAILARLSAEATGSQSDKRVSSSVGAIISGLPGVGKTALAKAICDSLGKNAHVRFLHAADVFQTYVGHSEAQIVKTFEELAQHAPSILVVDGLESVATSRQGFLDSDSTLEVGVLGTFVSCLDKLKLSNARVFVLGTTSRMDDIDAAVYSNGRMDLIVRLEPPSQKDRCNILGRMTRGWAMDTTKPDILNTLSEATGGFVGADLLSMCQKALQICLNDPTNPDRQNPTVLYRHFEDALAITYPSVLQAHHVSLRQHNSSSSSEGGPFSGIYGVDEALKTITVSLLEPLEDCSRFLQFGTVPPKGVLLTGPPGSGKTHLANVVAAELRRRGLASFVSVRCTDLLTKVVGDTEKALRELFETARSAAPCVIYFDQIESIAPVRGFDTSTEQTFDRLLSMLLVEMDGFSTSRESLQQSMTSQEARSAFLKNHIVILASTNEKNQLDPAILRPGRFDVHIELSLPDRDARVKIFLDELKQVPVDFSSDEELSSGDRLAAFVADHTEGFTAGDLTSLLREAAMASMRENFHTTTIAVRFVHAALQQRQVLKTSSQR